MNKNICPRCQTENEPEYLYCKNCGVSLEQQPEIQQPEVQRPVANPYAPPTYTAPQQPVYTAPQQPIYAAPQPTNEYIAGDESIEGIPVNDMSTFVGKKANSIIPKFLRMQLFNNKVNWCWPAAVWGFFLGPLGAAVWFMYRKMYKLAFIFAAIGIIVSAGSTLIAPEATGELSYENGETFVDSFFAFLEDETPQTATEKLVTFFEDIIYMASAVVAGLFGLYWYKQNAVNKIYSYRASNPDPRYYPFALCSMGGTSVGFAILLVIGSFIIEELIVQMVSFIIY